MKVDLLPLDIWDNLNLKVQGFLQTPPDSLVRCFPGVSAAAYEIAMGVTQFYSHKRALGIVKGQTHVFQSVLPYLYKEGYTIQFLEAHHLNDWSTWIDGLKKDTNFVMLAEDHPVTGEYFDWDEIDQKLNEKRIFCIRISHQRHFFQPSEVRPYSVQVRSFAPDVAVAVCGSKFRVPPLIVQHLCWKKEAFFEGLQFALRGQKENKQLIQNFEQNLPPGLLPYFKHDKRSFDRAAIFSATLSGEALRSYLLQGTFSSREPGWEQQVETTNLCRWGSPKLYQDWWEPRPSDDVLRGLLIINSEFLAKGDLSGQLMEALKDCQI